MKKTYPIILTPSGTDYVVYIPDFDIYTQGKDLTEAIEMAKDAIGIMWIDMEDNNIPLPVPKIISDVEISADDIVSLVDVDFMIYRREKIRITNK